MAASNASAHSDVNHSGQMSARRGKPVHPVIAGIHQGGAYVGDALKDVVHVYLRDARALRPDIHSAQ